VALILVSVCVCLLYFFTSNLRGSLLPFLLLLLVLYFLTSSQLHVHPRTTRWARRSLSNVPSDLISVRGPAASTSGRGGLKFPRRCPYLAALRALLHPRVTNLPPHVQTVFMQNALKVQHVMIMSPQMFFSIAAEHWPSRDRYFFYTAMRWTYFFLWLVRP